MKLLIEIPAWLGDAVMVTPAIENIANYYNEHENIAWVEKKDFDKYPPSFAYLFRL